MYLPRSPSLAGCVVTIPDGAAGINATIATMRQMVREYRTHPAIRGAALSIVALAPPKDLLAEVVALFEFVRDHVRYIGDVLDVETLTTPDKTLQLRAGDCDDKSVLLAALLESIGINTRFVVTGYNENGVFEHVYLKAMLSDGSLIALDPSETGPAGFEPPDPVVYFTER